MLAVVATIEPQRDALVSHQPVKYRHAEAELLGGGLALPFVLCRFQFREPGDLDFNIAGGFLLRWRLWRLLRWLSIIALATD